MLSLILLPLALGGAPDLVTVTATFVAPAKPGANGAIAVTFVPKDPEVHVNEEPAPRLKLDAGQKILVDKQPPAPSRIAPVDPEVAHYLDPRLPVSFPVALAPGAPKGAQMLTASVTYFFCSKREGWCRKGTSEVEVPLSVP
jgi:hypothetical protein